MRTLLRSVLGLMLLFFFGFFSCLRVLDHPFTIGVSGFQSTVLSLVSQLPLSLFSIVIVFSVMVANSH